MSQTTLYARVLAKIGAERSKLLSETKIKTLTESKDLASFVSQLRDTSYQTQISKLPAPLSSRKLERAFNENLIEAYEKLILNSPKKARGYLRLRLIRLEVENIKALIKATNASLTPEQKLTKIYLSVEDYLKNRAVFEEAVKATGIKQLVGNLKGTIYASCLNLGLQGYEENGSTARFDILIDKTFLEMLRENYLQLSKSEKTHAKFYTELEIDSFTLLTFLRGKILNFDANWLKLAIPQVTFSISKETIESLYLSTEYDSALKIVLDSHYGNFFAKAPSPEETIGNAEKAFRKEIFEHARVSKVTENFNIGAPLSFIIQKEAEVHNLIAISSGVEASITPDRIQSQLLL